MSIPAIIFLVLSGMGLLYGAFMHGKPREDYNFWSILISTALTIGLLWWGGFFK
jgi:hypothetical protein